MQVKLELETGPAKEADALHLLVVSHRSILHAQDNASLDT